MRTKGRLKKFNLSKLEIAASAFRSRSARVRLRSARVPSASRSRLVEYELALTLKILSLIFT